MIKKLKDWRLLLLVGALLGYGLILLTMVNDFYELPSEGFSKEVVLRTYEKNDTYDAYNYKGFDSGGLGQGFYLLVNDGKQLLFETYSATGEMIMSTVVKEEQETVVDVSTVIKEDMLVYIIATEEGLFKGKLSIETGALIDEVTISEAYDIAEINDVSVVFSEGNQFYYFENDKVILFEDGAIRRFDYVIADDSLFMSTVSRDGGPFFTDYYTVDLEKNTWEKTFIREYITSNSTRDADHVTYLENDQLKMMSVFRDTRFSNTFYKEVTCAPNDPTNFDFYKFQMDDFPNFTYLKNDGSEVQMMVEKFTFVQKDELASGDSTYRNLVLLTREGESFTEKRMTKMKKAHPVYQYFLVENQEYLVFNTVEKNIGHIYFASSNPEVIVSSNVLNSSSLKELIFGALTVLPAALAVGFIPSMGFVLPVILVIMPLSMIKITWAERYPDKMLKVAIGVYLVSLLLSFYENANMILLDIQGMAGSLPWHMKSVMNMYVMLAITFGISYLAYKWYYAKKPETSFMIHFGIMFITQSVLYILLFNAYPLLAN